MGTMVSDTLVVHDRGNVWYSLSNRHLWRDPVSNGWIPLGYRATRYSEDCVSWIRLTVKQHRGLPLYHFETHEGDSLETTTSMAANDFVFMKQTAGIDDPGMHRWKRCFGLPLEDVDEGPFCARQRLMEDACRATNLVPALVFSHHPKLLWFNPPVVPEEKLETLLPISSRTRQKRIKK
jgi:hypothetical protein